MVQDGSVSDAVAQGGEGAEPRESGRAASPPDGGAEQPPVMNETTSPSSPESSQVRANVDPPVPVDAAPSGSDEPSVRTDLEEHGASTGSAESPQAAERAPRGGTTDRRASAAAREPKIPVFKTLEELFRFAYAQGGAKRLPIAGQAFDTLVRSLDVTVPQPDPMRELVGELAATDPGLAVPVRMLVAFEQGSPSQRLTGRVLEYLAIVLRRHDALRRNEVRRLLDGETADIDAALNAMRDSVRGLPHEVFAGGATKGAGRHKLQLNASVALVLWFDMSNRLPVGEYVDLLDRHVWREELTKAGVKRPKAALAESRTPEVLGWLSRELRRRIEDATRSADHAELVAERARAREAELEEQLLDSQHQADRLRAEIAQLQETVANLQIELADQQHQRSVDRTHHVDDYKGLRARVLLSLDKQSDLLRNALHALRNERYVVADEYVERSLDAIDSERERLREQGA